MPRKSLSVLTYMGNKDSSIDVEAIYRSLLKSDTSFVTDLYPTLTDRTGKQHSDRPIFYSNISEISLLTGQIFENSKVIQSIQDDLPNIAKRSLVNSLLTDEIKYSNDIENIDTKRHDLGNIVSALNNGISIKENRLVSTVKKYIDAIESPEINSFELSNIRNTYDELMRGEIDPAKSPDGKLFRDGAVMIGSSDGSKVVHRPPISESQINQKLSELVEFTSNDKIPVLEKAIITHFMFENIHPFYDGNGRTGRYLLTQYLSRKVDPFTALSISGSIVNQEKIYYRSFSEADKYENYAELTFFIHNVLNMIVEGQKFTIKRLLAHQRLLEENMEKITNRFSDCSNSEVIIEVLSLFVQSKLFNVDRSLGIKDTQLVNTLFQHDRKIFKREVVKQVIDNLESQKILKLVSKKPIQHEIIMENI